MKIYIKICIAFVVLLGGVACESLDTEDLNNGDLSTVFSDTSNFQGVLSNSFNRWIDSVYDVAPGGILWQADVLTSNTDLTFTGLSLSSIPRTPIVEIGIEFPRTVREPFQTLHSIYGSIYQLLRAIEEEHDGVVLDPLNGADITKSIKTNAKALQGLCLGYLSMIYDRSAVYDESITSTELATTFPEHYTVVRDSAVSKLKKAAQMFESDASIQLLNTAGIPNLSGRDAAVFLRNFAASFLAYSARTPEEANALDWNEIKALTSERINNDIIATSGFYFRLYFIQRGFRSTRVHQRVINMMEGGEAGPDILGSGSDALHLTAPYPFPDGVTELPDIDRPRDQRLVTMFRYREGAVPFSTELGMYRFSMYELDALNGGDRFDARIAFKNQFALLYAEALIRTEGSKIEVANIINETRVNKGELPALVGTESNESLLKEIYYEKLVEYSWFLPAHSWAYRRMTPIRTLQLEPGTPRHFPIPRAEQELLNLTPYNFGGIGNEQ